VIASNAEPFQVLVREFQDIGHGGHAADAAHMRLLVLDEPRADVRIERDDPALIFALHQRLVPGNRLSGLVVAAEASAAWRRSFAC